MRKYKHHILYTVIVAILLSLITINNDSIVSALSYSSNVGVGFTFNPTLSVSISPSDLVISNLVPGSTLDSNAINVSVASNASYGYTLSASVSNESLVHSNNINTFSSIATNADLSDLDNSEDTNIWGYSTSLDSSTTWSSYNGLSSSNNITLINTNSNVSSNLDFKIAAKAASTQASGTYTGVINFTAVSNVTPMSLLDSFIASGAEMYNGYFKMQDMTHSICSNVDIEESELQLIDVRDNRIYWVAKLKDGNCWMTQNLDLDLSHEVALTSETSDIDPESYGTTIYTTDTGYSKDETTGVVSWLPSTIDNSGIQRADTIDMIWNGDSATTPGWTNNYNNPYSANPGNRYRYTSPSSYGESNYNSLETCANANNNDINGCGHTHFGNYYNWSATAASNNTYGYNSGTVENSICPKNWSLPSSNKYKILLQTQGVWSNSGNNYTDSGFNNLRTTPLYFARFGSVYLGSSYRLGLSGYYWSNKVNDADYTEYLGFTESTIQNFIYAKRSGLSVRCIAR